jgi:ArsR family transcriptional regulator
MPIDYGKESGFFRALGHPVRLRIVEGLLKKRECNVNRMVAGLGLPQSTVSQHLAALRHAGIVAVRKEGVKICYRVADPRIAKILKEL